MWVKECGQRNANEVKHKDMDQEYFFFFERKIECTVMDFISTLEDLRGFSESPSLSELLYLQGEAMIIVILLHFQRIVLFL